MRLEMLSNLKKKLMISPKLEPAVLTIFPMSDTVYIKLLIRIYSLFGLIRQREARQELEI
jgi:hypothetical protein